MAGRKPLATSQAIELVLEGRAILIMSEELCKYRKKLDEMDDKRRADMINKEDYFFRLGLAYLREGKYKELQDLMDWFKDFKLKDREMMLYYEQEDDMALERELERFQNGHIFFGEEAEKLEVRVLEENFENSKNKKSEI